MASPRDLPSGVEHSAITGIIEPGCEFEGKLSFLGAVRISGTFRGEIYTPDTLVIGEGARVQARIQAGTVIISGEVSGQIRAQYRVEIQKPAIFRGDIHTPSLRVEDGVIFEGSSKMVRGAPAP
ncbi:MAG: polymer-forming cytoskeletal protein [Betaproteobacteria bacterium]|nr:polymer-forming cytoskeletal protein [Betaproteobacteria bacterium]